MERDPTTHIQSQERLQAFTLKEIKEVIKMLKQRKAPSRHYYCQNVERTTKRGDLNPLNAELNPIRHLLALVGARHIVHVSRVWVKHNVYIQCHTTT